MAGRSTSGLFAALILAIGLGLAVLLAVPLRACPTCLSLTKKDPRGFRVDCPDCGDRGTATQVRHWRGSLLSPPVEALLQSNLKPEDIVLRLKEVAVLAGCNPAEVIGSKFFSSQRSGRAMFRRVVDHDVVVVALEDRGVFIPGETSVGLVLLSLDGRVLDYVHWGFSSRGGSLRPRLLRDSVDGAFVEIQGSDFGGSESPINASYATMRPEPEGSPRNYLTKSILLKTCRVGLKGDRFTLLYDPLPR